MSSVRETVGAILLAGGSIAFGSMLAPILVGGSGCLTAFEALVFVDGLAAVAVGAWMLLVRTDNP